MPDKRTHSRVWQAATTVLIGLLLVLSISCDNPGDAGRAASSPRKTLPMINGEAQFNSVVEASEKPLLLFEFFADWCAPCKALEPILEEIAAEHADTVAIYKINLDENWELADLFKVRGIPYVGFVKNKVIVYSLMGLHPKETYLTAIKEFLKP